MRLSPKLPRSVQINKGGNFYGSPLNHYQQLGCCFLLNFYSMRREWVNQVIVVAKIFGSSLILKLLNGHVILYKPIARQKNNSQILTVQSKNKTTGKIQRAKSFFGERIFLNQLYSINLQQAEILSLGQKHTYLFLCTCVFTSYRYAYSLVICTNISLKSVQT